MHGVQVHGLKVLSEIGREKGEGRRRGEERDREREIKRESVCVLACFLRARVCVCV